MNNDNSLCTLILAALTSGWLAGANAAPVISRLTPPSELFASGQSDPVVARFLPGQRFDLQATIRPDAAGKSIIQADFAIDGQKLPLRVAYKTCDSGCVAGMPANATIATLRAVSVTAPGRHTLTLTATQNDGQTVTARGNFEVVPLTTGGRKVKNIIIMLGDGMGASQRTAARIVGGGYAQGKTIRPLAMDSFPVTGMVKTASLNSVVTDSSPGMTSYVSGNKNNNNEEGVFPDDTVDPFDNPRIEYLSEYLHRTQGKALGLVTTADVFDATPAGNAVHTSNRGAGTGIVDQFFDDRGLTGLTVLMGGGRKWFLPSSMPGSARSEKNGYAFSASDAHTAEIVRRWGAAPGTRNPARDLLGEFQSAGFAYAPDKTALDRIDPTKTDRLLGLFALSNMNVALDKIAGRRDKARGATGSVVDDYGFPDQPMLDEMTDKALAVLARQPQGFVLMVEGASIDKQAHNMDTERWILETLEFDRAIRRVKDFAAQRGDTLVIVTADHECAGASLIGASRVTDARLQALVREGGGTTLRDKVVGVYEQAGFPKYRIAADGYPETTDIDYRLLVGYGANADRHEDYRTNDRPLQDSQQPFVKQTPLATYPASARERDLEGKLLLIGQVPGESAVHTATDIPLSAYGPGAWSFTGVQDNTDVFFKLVQATRGVVMPAGLFR
ncbi:alkaline phosphatase [Paludibacterium purpuratum]|uniref:Alkaline phosphatase n=1 Tax=Paludibacterium purpuratum TaxID=1144873 RepID=A0A4R7B961_9NEIS|nr:alkaline phosphatase [Paludibacterium purpuratum]TDR80226.1 alkaline phosphatase [Paludibacterium purpuratum]